MNAEEKKQKVIEAELIKKLGVEDKATLEKLTKEIDTFAKVIIDSYK